LHGSLEIAPLDRIWVRWLCGRRFIRVASILVATSCLISRPVVTLVGTMRSGVAPEGLVGPRGLACRDASVSDGVSAKAPQGYGHCRPRRRLWMSFTLLEGGHDTRPAAGCLPWGSVYSLADLRSLRGPPRNSSRRCLASCCDWLHIDGVLSVCVASLVPRVAVGECAVAPGDNGGSKQPVAVLMAGAKPLAFPGVGSRLPRKHGTAPLCRQRRRS
jgi:hypothetical protein